MTPIAAVSASASLLAPLAIPAGRAILLSLAAGLALAASRVKTTSLRLFTWTAVLYSALAMPLLQWVLPPLPVPAPAIFQRSTIHHAKAPFLLASTVARTEHALKTGNRDNFPATSSVSTREDTKAPRTVSTSVPMAAIALLVFSIPWQVWAETIYLAVASFFLARFFLGLALSQHLLRSSRRIDDERLTSRLISRARAMRLASTPLAAESKAIAVPLAVGVLRSAILLPSGWREWNNARLDAVLAHELSHIARRDPLTQRLSLLHRAVFWFSPLAWWLDRHLADLAEQASDEAALSAGADRKDYARTLLGFFEDLHASAGRVRWQGVSMANCGQAEQRVERILSWKGAVTMTTKKSLAVALLTLAAPVIYVAAAVHPSMNPAVAQAQVSVVAPQSAQSATPEVAPTPRPDTQTDPTPAPPAINGPEQGVDSGVSSAPDAPPPPPEAAPRVGRTAIAPVAPVAPVRPVAAIAPVAPQAARHGFSYHYGFNDDDDRFVIVSGKTDSLTMSGSSQDAHHVEKLRKQISGDFIWFQRDEKSYVIRDQATIDRAKALWAPQQELGKQQEELGKQQEVLGKQQSELGAKMEQIRVSVPDMSAELEKLKAELKALSAGATTEQVGHIQSEIGELQSKIGDIQSKAGDQQGKLGEEMGALGEKQGKLGEQQGELGRRQGELAEKATVQMKQLLDEAIKKGTAQPEL